MNNKYLYMVMGGIFVVFWLKLGHMAYFAHGQVGMSLTWDWAMVIAIGLGAGSTGGDDVVSILVEGVKGYVTPMILMAILGFILGFNHTVVVRGAVDVDYTVWVTLTMVVSGLFTNLTMSYLRKALK